MLCATFPGTGKISPPSQAAAQALTSGNVQQVMADLFPANQSAAQQAYLTATAAYPPAEVPAATIAAQGHAMSVWLGGIDPAGQQTATIAAPTLIADGTIDRLDPVANDYALAQLIRGARLKLYPDAGHAFLFQDEKAFIPLLESFLH